MVAKNPSCCCPTCGHCSKADASPPSSPPNQPMYPWPFTGPTVIPYVPPVWPAYKPIYCDGANGTTALPYEIQTYNRQRTSLNGTD